MSGKGAHEGRPYVRLGGGRGWVPAPVFMGVGLRGGWVPASARTTKEGVGFWLGVEDVLGEDSAAEGGE